MYCVTYSNYYAEAFFALHTRRSILCDWYSYLSDAILNNLPISPIAHGKKSQRS